MSAHRRFGFKKKIVETYASDVGYRGILKQKNLDGRKKKTELSISVTKRVLKRRNTKHPKISSIFRSYHESNVTIAKSVRAQLFKAGVGGNLSNTSFLKIFRNLTRSL